MFVNELAKKAKVTPHLVRYYTRIGLLQPVRHPDNGYKVYRHADLMRLRFIRRAQSLGFALSEVTAILEDSSRGESPCPRVRDIIRQRIEENRRKLVELAALQNRMEDALAQWETMPDGVPDGDCVCHLIESAPPD